MKLSLQVPRGVVKLTTRKKGLAGFWYFSLGSMEYYFWNNALKSIISPCDDPYSEKKFASGLFGADGWAFAGMI